MRRTFPRSPSPFDRPMERRVRRRESCRAPVRVYATPDTPEDSFVLESTDVIADGVFLHTDLLFPVGEWLDLEFEVPGRLSPIRGRGRVVRVDGGAEPPGPGVALRLKGLSAEEQAAIYRLGSTAWRT